MAAAGYERTTVEDLATAIGVSRVTLHRHGIGKSEVLQVLGERATREYQDAMWPMLTSSAPADERLGRAIDVVLAQAERHLALLVALGSQSDGVFHEDESAPGAPTETRSVFVEPLQRIIDDAVREGTVVDDGSLATVVFNTVGWSYIHLRTGHRWSCERAAASVRRLVLHGLLTP